MDFGFESFDSGFSDLDVDVEDIVIKRTKKFERIWEFTEGGSVFYHVLNNGIAYFGSMDGYVYAVDIETGKEVWKFKTGSRNAGSVSNVSDGILAVPCFDNNVYALSIVTGKELWRFRTGGKVYGAPIIDNGKVFAASRDGYLYAITIDGKELWRFRTGDEIGSSPSVSGNNVFIGSFDGYLYCLNTESGKEIWRFKTGGEIQHDKACLVHENIIYFSSFDNYLYAVDINTGKEIWRFRTGKFGNSSFPAIMNGRLYVGSRDGILYALDMNGREIWRFKTNGLLIGVTSYNGRIYFTSEDGNLHVLSEYGEEIWRYKFGTDGSFDYPSIERGKVIVASKDCHLYALDAENGHEIWRFQTSSLIPTSAPPVHDSFEMEIKKSGGIEEAVSEDKYKSKKEQSVSLSDYHVKSEYATTSEYKQKSDYDTSFVLFEGVMEVEGIWISDSNHLIPASRISTLM